MHYCLFSLFILTHVLTCTVKLVVGCFSCLTNTSSIILTLSFSNDCEELCTDKSVEAVNHNVSAAKKWHEKRGLLIRPLNWSPLKVILSLLLCCQPGREHNIVTNVHVCSKLVSRTTCATLSGKNNE